VKMWRFRISSITCLHDSDEIVFTKITSIHHHRFLYIFFVRIMPQDSPDQVLILSVKEYLQLHALICKLN